MNIIYLLFSLTFISMLVEFFCISPGGLLVPIFLAAYYLQPQAIIGTFIIAAISYSLLLFANYVFLIQKKHKFILTILITTGLIFLWRRFLPYLFPQTLLFETVGWIIPGILSYTMQKNGFFKTLLFTTIMSSCLIPFYMFINYCF